MCAPNYYDKSTDGVTAELGNVGVIRGFFELIPPHCFAASFPNIRVIQSCRLRGYVGGICGTLENIRASFPWVVKYTITYWSRRKSRLPKSASLKALHLLAEKTSAELSDRSKSTVASIPPSSLFTSKSGLPSVLRAALSSIPGHTRNTRCCRAETRSALNWKCGPVPGLAWGNRSALQHAGWALTHRRTRS